MTTASLRHSGDNGKRLSAIDWSAYADDDDVATRGSCARLVGLCLAALAALLIVVVTGMRFDGVTLWETYVTKSGETEMAAATRFSGLNFGVSVGRASRLRPDLALAPTAGGELAGTYESRGIHHTVAFLNGEHGYKAYRFRTVRLLERNAERGVVNAMVDEFGKPTSSSCSNQVYAAGRFCHHTWMTKGGVLVEVVGRAVVEADGRERVELTATYVDLYLEGLKRRPGHSAS